MKELRGRIAAVFVSAGIVGFVATALFASFTWGWHVWVLFIPLAVFTLGAIMLEEHS